MPSYRPSRRPPRLGSISYSTRLLLGYVGSLSLLLLIAHLPVFPASSSPEWLLASHPEQIRIDQVREPPLAEAAGSDGASSKASVRPSVSTTSADTGRGRSGDGVPDKSLDSTGTSVRSITALTDVRAPRMVGGLGYYYLQIRYPAAARQAGIEGRLRLQFVVTSDGHPRDIRVIKSLHPLCDSAAVQALRSVRFRPARQTGDPIPVRTTLPVRFRLVDSTASGTAPISPQ